MYSACCLGSQASLPPSVDCAICESEIVTSEEPLFIPFNDEDRQVCSSCHGQWTKWQDWLQDGDDNFIALPDSFTVIPESEVEACLTAGQSQAVEVHEGEKSTKWNLSILYHKVRRCLAL